MLCLPLCIVCGLGCSSPLQAATLHAGRPAASACAEALPSLGSKPQTHSIVEWFGVVSCVWEVASPCCCPGFAEGLCAGNLQAKTGAHPSLALLSSESLAQSSWSTHETPHLLGHDFRVQAHLHLIGELS